ncbi:MAG: hypothetical protein ACYC3N_04835 [Halothiobacillus sp.]
MIERDQLAALQGENARLIALLEDYGIEWRLPPEPTPPVPAPPAMPSGRTITLQMPHFLIFSGMKVLNFTAPPSARCIAIGVPVV